VAFSEQTKQEALARADGHCECMRGAHGHVGRCSSRGPFEYHHKLSLASGGGDALSNCEVLCKPCHRRVRRPS
jgi:5-methylcytosine-specific restriction protein A